MIAWWGHVFGLDNASGHWYLFWSGFGGDIPIFVAVYAAGKHLNCHQSRCPRIARHVYVDGQRYCRKHAVN